MVDIKKSGKYCYVEGDDCYILYYLFLFRLNDNRCYFKVKYLKKVLNVLGKKEFNYTKYVELGKKKYEFDRYLLDIENKFNSMVDSRNFNKIYRKIISKIYE